MSDLAFPKKGRSFGSKKAGRTAAEEADWLAERNRRYAPPAAGEQEEKNIQGVSVRSKKIAGFGKLSKQERAHLDAGKSWEAVRNARRANK